ncbi:MAG: hypothetical protein EOO11_18755 [Chitinophagaceae bacterium]|nr:MAG: hypothetical protein EOO11_18755 [Chitinophagaceae bacterium]
MSDSETIQVAFHETARPRFFALVAEFFAQASDIDRQRDELRYRQLCTDYVHSLRRGLEDTAQDLLRQHQHQSGTAAAGLHLQQAISEYVHAFVQKTR